MPPINSNGAPMDNDARVVPLNQLYLTGDERGNQNPGLLCMQALFLREHNRLVDELRAQNSSWDSETVFQQARRWVIAKMQAIVFHDYLPATVRSPSLRLSLSVSLSLVLFVSLGGSESWSVVTRRRRRRRISPRGGVVDSQTGTSIPNFVAYNASLQPGIEYALPHALPLSQLDEMTYW